MKKYSNGFLILILYIEFLFNLQIINSSKIEEVGKHIVISLKKEINNNDLNLSPDKYMEELIYKQLYSKNNIGIPIQKIKFYYEMNDFESSISEDFFEKIRSSSYKCIDKKCPNKNSELNDFIIKDKNGFKSQDIFELNPDNKLNNFTFVLKPKGKTDSGEPEYPNSIGLGLKDNNRKEKDIESLSFMEQLKRYKYIDKKIFTLLTDENSVNENRFVDGYILMGCLPHEVHPLFEEKDLKWISNKDTSKASKSRRYWHINFDSVKYNNEIIKERFVNLDLSLNVIIGPESFRQKLLNGFFEKQLENKKCKEELFFNSKDEEHYIFYSCGNDAEFIEIPKLSFYSKELNETFELPFDKLFSQYRHRFYFNVIFNKKEQNDWVLGQIFLNSYRFVFDAEEERVGYYKTQIPENHPFIALFCIVLALVIFFIIYLNGNRFININQENVYDNQQRQKKLYQPREEYANTDRNNNEIRDNKNKIKEKKAKKD